MPIEFSCPTCFQLVRTPEGTAGKKGKCPHCGAVVQIPWSTPGGPAADTSAPWAPSQTPPVSAPQPSPHQSPRPSSGTIDFHCAACGALVRAPAGMAGKRGKCGQCQGVVQIPRESQATGESGSFGKKATSKSPLASADTVEDLPALTPIGGGLAAPPPFRAPTGSFSAPPSPTGLTPIPGLTPLPASSYSSVTPVTEDSLADLSRAVASSPFVDPVADYVPRPKPQPVLDDRGRGGLPWEQCPSMDAFGDTILTVVSAPHDAFSKMRRFGGVGNPMGFLVVARVLGQFLLLVEWLAIMLGWAFLFRGGMIELGPGKQVSWEVFLIVYCFFALGQLTGAVFAATVGGLLLAVIFHMGLILVGAKGGFETTYRVVAFGSGSVYMLLPIPIVGPFFALVMTPLVFIYGFMHAHEISGGRAVIGAFLPAILLVTCCAVVVIAFILPALAPYLHSPAQ